MTPAEVTAALADRVSGRRSTIPSVRKGARVAVRAGGIEAFGTVRFGYGSADTPRAVVVLDGTGTEVDVSWSLLWPE